MNRDEFRQSLNLDQPPETFCKELQALWWDAKGDWQSSHHTAQEISSKNGSLIHAYLHPKEGDNFNADYWYQRSGSHPISQSVEEECDQLLDVLIANETNS